MTALADAILVIGIALTVARSRGWGGMTGSFGAASRQQSVSAKTVAV